MSSIQLAIFDLDGVLTETSQQHYQAWKELADELNVPFDKAFNENLKGVSRMDSLELILNKGNLADQYCHEEKVALATKKNELYKSLIENFTPDYLFDGVKELFAVLEKRGIKIALASASKNAPGLLKNMGIAGDFDYIVDPSSLENGKPDPAIFLKAARELGVDPDNCIGFEDAYAGVQAIKSAGMFAIGIGEAEVLNQADVVYSHIKDVEIEKYID